MGGRGAQCGGLNPGLEPSLAASLRSGTTISSLSPGVHSGYQFRTVGTGEGDCWSAKPSHRLETPGLCPWGFCVSFFVPPENWLYGYFRLFLSLHDLTCVKM